MLIGPTSGGKTTVRKLLRHALYLNEATGANAQKVWKKLQFYFINPCIKLSL